MAQSAIRDYLRSKGLSDGDITYNNGTVMAKGQRFMDATPQADGRTYADTNTLNNAYNNYDMTSQLAQMRTQATQTNPEVEAMKQALKDRVNKPIQQFSYNSNSDPAYKSALESIRQNTQTDMNNARVEAGAVGMRGGSLQNNQLAQASLRNQQKLQNEITPQLMQQAYQRYIGQQNLENQQTGNMMTYADYLDRTGQQKFRNSFDLLGTQNALNQQDYANNRNAALDAYNQQRNRIQDAQWGVSTYGYGEAKNDPGVFFDQYKDATPLAVQQAERQRSIQEAGLTGEFNGQPTMDARRIEADNTLRDRQLGISERNADLAQDDNARAWEELDRKLEQDGGSRVTDVAKSIRSDQNLWQNETATDDSGRTRNTGRKVPVDKNMLKQRILTAPLSEAEQEQLFKEFFSAEELKAMGYQGN